MAWVVLLVSAVLEAVWATALGASEGFTRPVESIVFVVGCILSMVGLERAARSIPIATAYAVWVGIGATLTVVWSMATGAESVDKARIALLVLLVGCVAGLKAVA